MQYPSSGQVLPYAKDLYEIVTGKVQLNKTTAVKAAWMLQGYIQGVFFGEPGVTPASVDGALESVSQSPTFDTQVSDKLAVAYLGELCQSLEVENDTTVRPASIGAAVGGALPMLALKVLLPVVQRWLTDWLLKDGLTKLVESLQSPE